MQEQVKDEIQEAVDLKLKGPATLEMEKKVENASLPNDERFACYIEWKMLRHLLRNPSMDVTWVVTSMSEASK